MIEALLAQALGQFTPVTVGLVALAALVTSAIHGATGIAGGFLLVAALAPVIGVKPIVPIISVALVISHSVRALLNVRDFNRTAFLAVAVPAVPFIVMGALLYGQLSGPAIAGLLASVILASIPLRRWAKHRSITAGLPSLAGAGAVYGGLSGTSIGPGMLLIPFLLGYGLTKEAFVATLAAIALLTNVTRLSVFGSTDLLQPHLVVLGVLVGLVTIPGNWIGRVFLRRMTGADHALFVDILTVIGATNLLWLAVR